MAEKINVLLVDDSRARLAEFERVFADLEDVSIVGMASDGAAAIRMANDARPDLVLMDLAMPGLDGLSALRTIKTLHPEIEVAMIATAGEKARRAAEAFRLGACQVLAKPVDAQLLGGLIENVKIVSGKASRVPA